MITKSATQPAPRKRRPLTPRQVRFIAEYSVDLNATQAARRAGYSAKVANREGSRLLSNAVIAEAIAEATAEHLAKADLTAARVLEELRRLAFVDVADIWDDRGNIKPFSEWTVEQRASLAGFEAIIKNARAGDGQTDEIHKVKFHDKTKALDLLARHFALLHDRVAIEGIDWNAMAAVLAGARASARNRA